MTVEDPIEYELAGIGQTQVNAKIDLTFAKALRAILRQDPDVIMIGEIRDLETAQIAIQASLTGHLVLATLHTNDAPSRRHPPARHGRRALPAVVVAAGRAGAAPGAQAVRVLQAAGRQRPAGTRSAASTAATPATRAAPASTNCSKRTRQIRAQIHNQVSEADIRDAALKSGMQTMRDDGERWVARASPPKPSWSA